MSPSTHPDATPAATPSASVTPAGATMRAAAHHAYGLAEDVLAVRDLPVPTPGSGQVLVRVAAAGLDRGIEHLVEGRPRLVRLAGYGVRRPKNPVVGSDVAGTVVAVGPDVQGFAAGDEVLGIARGSWAEFALVDAERLTARPAALPVVEAAALPVSGITALQAVRDHAKVQPGERVLVMGASGGVGSYVVQIARAAGAEITGVASGAKLDLVRDLGAVHVVDHRTEDALATGERYDVIIDTGGMRRIRDLRRALTPTGRLIIIGGENGGQWTGGVQRQLGAMLLSPFVGQRMATFIAGEKGDDVAELVDLVLEGSVRVPVDRTYDLDQAVDAIRDLAAGRIRGKAVVVVAAPE